MTDEPTLKLSRSYKVIVQDEKKKRWYAIDFPLGQAVTASGVTNQDALEIEMMLHGALCRWRTSHPQGCAFKPDGTPNEHEEIS